jgi:hypothetical protein
MNGMVDVIHAFWQNLQVGVVTQIGSWNYLIIALLVAVEGPIVTLLGASASAAGYLKTGYVFLAAAAGNVSADLIWYYLGYGGKIEWLLPYQRWLGIKPRQMDHLQTQMNKHAPKILFFCQALFRFYDPVTYGGRHGKSSHQKMVPHSVDGRDDLDRRVDIYWLSRDIDAYQYFPWN